MKSRMEAAKYAEDLMKWEGKDKVTSSDPKRLQGPHAMAWHFGFVELRKLLDFIYEGEPQRPGEMVLKSYDDNRYKTDEDRLTIPHHRPRL